MKLPTRRKYVATLFLKGGQQVQFTCSDLTARRTRDNDLTELTAQNSPDFPLYLRLDDVSAVMTRRKWL